MGYWWIAIPIVLTLVLIAVLVLLKSQREGHSVGSQVDVATTLVPVASEVWETEHAPEDEVFVSIALLPAATAIDQARLSEISDKTVIARISQTIPAAAETAARTVANNALKNMEVYKAILPSGKTLAESKTMEGAYRGFSRAANGDFSSHANLVKVDVSKTTAVASGVANVMNVASLVVGQYYMSEINDRLETLTKSVDRIGDFQKREFKSQIRSLVAHVWKVSRFRSEIMEDDTQRNNTLLKLDHLEMRATDLLEQVNTEIEDITQQNHEPKYEDYQERISELATLRGYQAALLVVLEEITELTYLLGRGSVSAERSRVLLGTYVGQSEQARAHLGEWHNCQVERLHIDLEQERRSKAGMDAVIAFVPSLIDGKFKYRQLGQGLAHEIGAQANPALESRGDLKEVYDEDVEIIIKGGKYFYLHESPASVAEHASGPPATNRNPPSASKKRVLWWQHPDDRSDMG